MLDAGLVLLIAAALVVAVVTTYVIGHAHGAVRGRAEMIPRITDAYSRGFDAARGLNRLERRTPASLARSRIDPPPSFGGRHG